MLVLPLDFDKVLIDPCPQCKDLAHIYVLFENLLPELPCQHTCLLDHLLELNVDLFELDDRLDLALDLETSRVELASLLLFVLVQTPLSPSCPTRRGLIELDRLITHPLISSRLEVGNDLTRKDEALVLILQGALLRDGEA